MNQLTAEERSKIIKLTEKHCKQMLDLIYKQKMAYFKSGGDDWREVLERSYPRDPPTGITFYLNLHRPKSHCHGVRAGSLWSKRT